MTLDSIIGGLTAVVIPLYLLYTLLRPRSSDMTVSGWLQIAFYSVALLLITKPLGVYVLKVYDGSLTWLRPIERLLYRAAGVDPAVSPPAACAPTPAPPGPRTSAAASALQVRRSGRDRPAAAR